MVMVTRKDSVLEAICSAKASNDIAQATFLRLLVILHHVYKVVPLWPATVEKSRVCTF